MALGRSKVLKGSGLGPIGVTRWARFSPIPVPSLVHNQLVSAITPSSLMFRSSIPLFSQSDPPTLETPNLHCNGGVVT